MRILAIPDLHYPYNDKKATRLALKVADAIQPNAIVILGDFVDNYAISSHDKDPQREGKVARELRGASDLISCFRSLSPKLWMLEGNHETRLARYIARKAPELHGMVDIRQSLGIAEKEWRPYGEALTIGKCHLVHDVGYCGQDAARKSLEAFGGNLVFGHTHRAEAYYSGNLRGERHFAISSGWLGDSKFIDYAKAPTVRKWQHGVTVVDQDTKGNSWATFVPFVGGKCMFEGVEIKL